MTSHGPEMILNRLQRFVAAGHLRYWIITSWALALATRVPLAWVLAWFVATMASGYARSLADNQTPPPSRNRKTTVAALSCISWAIAPLMAWFLGGRYGDVLAAVLLCSGYMLVFTQMRAAPREAVIVSTPYSVVTLIILADLWREPGFWTVAATLPVLAISLLVKVLITQIKDGQLNTVVERQSDLIGELQTARDRANAASEAKSNFLTVISHELRTPMNGVLGAAQLLTHSRLTARDQAYVAIIRNSGEGLLNLLNDLLDGSKIEAGQLDLHCQTLSLSDWQDRWIGACRSQALAKGLALHINGPRDPSLCIEADPMRIGQVVQNLLSNAIKFTDRGGVTLTIDVDRVDETRALLRFCVEDTGPGIAEADRHLLFQPFQQIDATSTRRFGGTGLGLSIARRLAQLMDGDITVQSTPGLGSAFTFTARVLRAEAPACGDRDSAAVDPQDALSVLVVEDHEVNRMILQAWLTSQGHVCVSAANGADGLAAAAVQAFDAILMDVNMPVLDGLAATRRLRSTPGPNQGAPVAILSASARPEDHQEGLAAGADVYLNKPLNFGTLSVFLSNVIARPNASACGSGEALSPPDGPYWRSAGHGTEVRQRDDPASRPEKP